MKKEFSIVVAVGLLLSISGLAKAQDLISANGISEAQNKEEPGLEDDAILFEDEEAKQRALAEENARKRAEEERRLAEEKERERKQKEINQEEYRKRDQELRFIDSLREASPTVTEYTYNPDRVEAVIELDPNNYGFRQRNHRMILGLNADFLLRGRGILSYEFRFFEYWSFALKAGLDWTSLSLVSRMRQQLTKPQAEQLTILGGLSAKWRLTEWYLKSSVFIEPSVYIGHLWQTFVNQESTHWRVRPGLFAGIESVFDSGLSMTISAGFEVPVDFASANPVRETIETLMSAGIGFAI